LVFVARGRAARLRSEEKPKTNAQLWRVAPEVFLQGLKPIGIRRPYRRG
jgi:hypothetical protein